jgi:KDO2-lipid IV(A) lauroyltransferase
MVVLARPIDNPLINDWLLGIREAQGTRVITKWGATPIIQSALRNSGRVGFIADQNAGEQGLFVPFFGRLASNYKSIGLLAMRYNVPIVVGHAIRDGCQFQYDVAMVDMIRPDDWADQPDPLFYITARYNRAMEQSIRAAPEQYLWLHRRWKSRPKHEREGEPMPHKLIEKLERLPWMTPQELKRVIAGPQTATVRA